MLNALEMWLWRRMARITWEMKRTNESVLQEIGVERELLRTLKNRKKKWLGHIMRGNSLYRTVMKGKLEGRKGRGRRRALLKDQGQNYHIHSWPFCLHFAWGTYLQQKNHSHTILLNKLKVVFVLKNSSSMW